MYSSVITSSIGKLGILTVNDVLTSIDFLSSKVHLKSARHAFTKEVVGQLQAYFKDPNFCFDLPIQWSVTDFLQHVLQALQKIPVGETRSYSELANQLKSGARAIGNACLLGRHKSHRSTAVDT